MAPRITNFSLLSSRENCSPCNDSPSQVGTNNSKINIWYMREKKKYTMSFYTELFVATYYI